MCSGTDEGQNVFCFILKLRIEPKVLNKAVATVPLKNPYRWNQFTP